MMMDRHPKNAEEVLNADEASAWLRIPKSTLYKLCTDGEVPAAKVGRHWRFHRDTLEHWLLDRSKPSRAQRPIPRT
jgi:excisionase family DNA binding protein